MPASLRKRRAVVDLAIQVCYAFWDKQDECIKVVLTPREGNGRKVAAS
jgi:hypothetical protein